MPARNPFAEKSRCRLIALILFLALTNNLTLSPDVIKVGGAIGIAFITAMLTMTYALTVAGASPVITSFRLSMLVPIALGVWIWNEPLGFVRAHS